MTEWIKTADYLDPEHHDDARPAIERMLRAMPKWKFAIAVWPDDEYPDSLRVATVTREGRKEIAEMMRWMRDEYIPQMLRTLEN